MIKSITITNQNSDRLVLELTSPEKSGLIVMGVNGLGPVKADVNITKSSSNDISKYTSARLNNRNIVLNLAYLANPTIEQTRQKTYLFFPLKSKVHVSIETDKRIVGCDGYVETNEAQIFAQNTSCQISILCPDPFFYDETLGVREVTFNSIDPLFTFPFYSTPTNKIEISKKYKIPSNRIINLGDSETGLIIRVMATGEVINPTIFNVTKNESMKLNVMMSEGDIIIINTRIGEKGVYYTRDGSTPINIISALDSINTWLTLFKGENEFTFIADKGMDNISISYEYVITYEGI